MLVKADKEQIPQPHVSDILANILRSYIERSGLRTSDIARLANVPKQSIENWLNGIVRQPQQQQWSNFVRIATALHLNHADTNALLQAAHLKEVEEIKKLPLNVIERQVLAAWESRNPYQYTTSSPPRLVEVRRLPMPLQKSLYGRDAELLELDATWRQRKTRIMSLVGMGGEGKSALTFQWLQQLDRYNYAGADAVFVWSFYSQGTSDRITSAGEFIDEALRSFGDPDPSLGSAQAKGERLARLIGQQRVLLILDGLEPLQYPPTTIYGGGIKDKSLQALLRTLAFANNGLCLITTRVPVRDLDAFAQPIVMQKKLSSLSDIAGASLLTGFGVKGEENELQMASNEYGGHALALTLLASYIKRRGGDCHIRERDTIAALERDPYSGGHARRVMKTYEQWFSNEELSVLSLIGLFDRPAERAAVEAIRQFPSIPGLTDGIAGIDETRWFAILRNLHQAGFLPADSAEAHYTFLDTHPLVREHFGERLYHTQFGAWRTGNARLFTYFNHEKQALPSTLEEMSPLYSAVFHGARAGQYAAALRLYRERILRGETFFSTLTLGATADDVAALSNFFDEPWTRMVDGLPREDETFIFHQVGWCLRSLGRLSEASQCLRTSLAMIELSQNWRQGAITAGLVSHIGMTTGKFHTALEFGQKAIKFADLSSDLAQQIFRRTLLAYVCNMTGKWDWSSELIAEAYSFPLPNMIGDFPTMYTYSLFHNCDLHEVLGQYELLYASATKCLKFVETHYEQVGSLARGLPHLALGRWALLSAHPHDSKLLLQAEQNLEIALEHIRLSDRQDCFALGLLARADLFLHLGRFELAQRDLDDTMHLTTTTGMTLFMADAYLGYAKLAINQNKWTSAKEALAQAKSIVQRTGYRRREREIARIEDLIRLNIKSSKL